MKILLGSVFLMLVVNGCATNKISQSNLYWGNYSETLYAVKKNPSEETKKAHEEDLQSIIESSSEMNTRVPPGIYAELGLYALEREDISAAQNYFRLEQETYPEGAVLMQHIMKDNSVNSNSKSEDRS